MLAFLDISSITIGVSDVTRLKITWYEFIQRLNVLLLLDKNGYICFRRVIHSCLIR